jgi:hypothetical protein
VSLCGTVEYLPGEECREDVADNTAHTVLSKDIECVINANHKFELRGIVARSSTDDAVNDGSPWRDLQPIS